MNIYDTLIIGSGYASIGYATACPNTVICEEHQICDTGFYLPMRSFCYKPYAPQTEAGIQLFHCFSSLSLFREDQQNTNGFEFAICKYVAEKQLNLLLKCRVVCIEQQENGIFDVTVHSNEGLTHLFAKKILDTTNQSGKRYFSVVFVCDRIDAVREQLLSAFDCAQVEPAFYPNRYALHILAHNTDENRIKLETYEKWRALDVDAKILHMAPVFYGEANAKQLCDCNYENPIQAFESGYFYAKESSK